MLPTKLNPLGVNPYDGVMEFEKVGNLCSEEGYKSYNCAITANTDEYIEVTDYGDGLANHNARGLFLLSVYLNPNTTYSFSIDIQCTQTDNQYLRGVAATFYYQNRNAFINVDTKLYGETKSLDRKTITGTFTTKSDLSMNEACRLVVRFNTTGVGTIENDQSFRVYKNTAIVVKGDTIPTEYEPYNNLYRCYGESTQYQNSGKNLLNPNVFLEPQTKNGVTFSYIPEEDVFCLNGTATAAITGGFRTKYPYDLILDTTAKYRMRSIIVSGTATFSSSNPNSGGVRVFYAGIGNGTEAFGHADNWIDVSFKKSEVDKKYGAIPEYSKLTEIWLYLIEAGDSFDNYKFRIQLEKGATATEYEEYNGCITTPSIDNPSPIVSNYPKGRYKTNLPGITIKLDDDLRGIDEYKDYVEVDITTKEKKVVKNIKEQYISKVIIYNINSTTFESGVQIGYYPLDILIGTPCLCNYLPYDTNVVDGSEIVYTSTKGQRIFLFMHKSRFESMAHNDIQSKIEEINPQCIYVLKNSIVTLL